MVCVCVGGGGGGGGVPKFELKVSHLFTNFLPWETGLSCISFNTTLYESVLDITVSSEKLLISAQMSSFSKSAEISDKGFIQPVSEACHESSGCG